MLLLILLECGKKCNLDEFIVQGRGGKGLKLGRPIAGAELVNDEDILLLVGSPNNICIKAADIVTQGRTTLGVKLAKNEINKVVKL